jgi:CHASE3 domain sensor protein
MAIPIFWRLILGTIGTVFLPAAACLYMAIELGTLSRTARSALDGDQRMIGYQEALTDSFLSEARYGGKFIFTHAEDRYSEMQQFKSDFGRYLGELKSLADSQEVAASLSKIDQLHRQYHELFDREVAYIRANQTYAQTRYQQERDKLLESALGELERLKGRLKENLQAKLRRIDRAARTSRRVGLLTILAAVILGAWFSLRISRSVAAPLKQPDRTAAGSAGRAAPSGWNAIEPDRPSALGGNFAKQMGAGLALLVENGSARWQRCRALAKSFTARKGTRR